MTTIATAMILAISRQARVNLVNSEESISWRNLTAKPIESGFCIAFGLHSFPFAEAYSLSLHNFALVPS